MIVVLVDDDEDDLEIFCEAVQLVEETIECIPINSCQQLLLFLSDKTATPDFFFVDLMMPAIGGMECIEAIRSDARLNSSKVVLYSSMVTAQQVEALSGFNATFLCKPVNFTDLVSEVKNVLKPNEV
jgi:DNA-binding NtrC family response regulator